MKWVSFRCFGGNCVIFEFIRTHVASAKHCQILSIFLCLQFIWISTHTHFPQFASQFRMYSSLKVESWFRCGNKHVLRIEFHSWIAKHVYGTCAVRTVHGERILFAFRQCKKIDQKSKIAVTRSQSIHVRLAAGAQNCSTSTDLCCRLHCFQRN